MLSEEEKKAIDELKEEINNPVEVPTDKFNTFILYNIESARTILNLIEKQSKEIEEYKKQLDLDYVDKHFVPIERYNQLEKEIEELIERIKELEQENREIREWKYVIDNPIDLEKLKELDLIKIKGKEYISKDKIKAKIEEYDMKDLTICYGGRSLGRTFQQAVRTEVKNILQSLLEKE